MTKKIHREPEGSSPPARQESTLYWQNLETGTRFSAATPPEERARHRVPSLTILAHPDVRRIGERAILPALTSGQDVLISRGVQGREREVFFAPPGGGGRLALADPHLSRSPLRLTPIKSGGVRLDISATRTPVTTGDGTFLAEDCDFPVAAIEHGVVLVLGGRVALLLHFLDPVSRDTPSFGLVGESRALAQVRSDIERVADVDAPVLVRGATGTGKELVARALHQAARRRQGPFVAVNMGAFPPSLATAELFGAVKGAYTGADRRRDGCFVRARGGTLFLDEIGETPPEVQVMLLRTLQERVVQPVGSEATQEVDVRIVAATDAELEAEIEAGRFRAPLLHRLSGYEIRLPPLAERRDDIGRLLVHFLREELAALGESWRLEERSTQEPWLPAPIVARLVDCEWPGNVRQLKNTARQLVLANRGEARLRLTPRLEELLEPRSTSVESKSASASAAAPAPIAGESEDRPVLRTLLMIDLVDSTRLVDRLGDREALTVMSRHDRATRALLPEYDGYEVDKSDGFLLLFKRPADAVGFALEYHETTVALSGELGTEVAARAGACLGEVFLRRNSPEEVARGAKALEVEGLSKPVAARLMEMASRRQTLVTRSVFDLARQVASGDHPLADQAIRWSRHGEYRLRGVEKLVEVCEIGVEETAPFTTPEGARSAERVEEASGSAERPSEIDDDEILKVLKEHDFRIQATAKALGVPRTTLNRLIDKSSRIRKPGDLSREEIEAVCERHGGDRAAMAEALEVSRKGLSRRMTELGLR